ncbi:hypothetical protein C0993_000724 [Termitomyces sp. T159_Od127]|nr:hypothetical protein C0993_000724 [Termitomyces sp. T159_Od127]
MSSNELVPVAELLGLQYDSRKFSASGLVRAWIDEDADEDGLDDDNEESDEEFSSSKRVRLSTILEFDVHSTSEVTGNPDSKMYIRTKYAWYILHMPTEEYRPFFTSFWIKHRVLHLLLSSAIRDRRTSYQEFLESLSDVEGDNLFREEALASVQMLGRVLTEADIQSEDVKIYAAGNFPEMCEDYDIPLKTVRLATEYLQFDLSDDEDSERNFEPRTKTHKPKSKRIPTQSVLSDKEMEVLKHRNTTYVTPIVSQIMKNLFSVPLHFAEIPIIEDDSEVITEIDNVKTHHMNPTSMRWGRAEGDMFSSLTIDGVEYCVGQNVMVVPGDDEDTKRARISETDASQSPNSYANHLWFCKICYFFEETVDGKKVKMFHGQWFIHGSKTILQETAHSKSLFLLKSCEDNPAASIFKKCNIKMLGPEDAEPPDDGQPHSNDFHCALAYDEKEASFTNLPSEQEMVELLQRETCISCATRKRQEQLNDIVITSDGFTRHGTNYHPNDFIYIRPCGRTTGLLDIAQITMIKVRSGDLRLTVKMLERPGKLQRSGRGLPWDERRLYLTDNLQDLDDIDLLDGMCFVRHLTDADEIDEWASQDDHFYVNQHVSARTGQLADLDAGVLGQCGACSTERARKHREQQRLLTRNGPIRCLELFSGAGGLGTGLDLSGFVETKYAVEFSPSAAATYAKNHPNTTVYCQDSNKLLKQAYEASKGETTRPLVSGIDGKTRLPPMPRRGDVDMVSGAFYGRLDGDGQFKCTMTTAAPNTKESWLLHPTQKRIMSVRELARSQGFPDDYVFLSEDKTQSGQKLVVNQIRQIGNAVPVPFALHLGKSLGAALLKDWETERERREREGSVVV